MIYGRVRKYTTSFPAARDVIFALERKIRSSAEEPFYKEVGTAVVGLSNLAI